MDSNPGVYPINPPYVTRISVALMCFATVQMTANVAWSVSDSQHALGAIRIALHVLLALTAGGDMACGVLTHTIGNRVLIPALTIKPWGMRVTLFRLAGAVMLFALLQIAANVCWTLWDAQSSLGVIRIAGHTLLAATAIASAGCGFWIFWIRTQAALNLLTPEKRL